MTKLTLAPPLFISSRLMAALKLPDGSTIHMEPVERRTESFGSRYAINRVVWRYVIEDASGQVLVDEADLTTTHSETDARDAMGSLLSFLGAAAEAYQAVTFGGRDSENSDLFPPAVLEWAYQNEDELAMLACELAYDLGEES